MPKLIVLVRIVLSAVVVVFIWREAGPLTALAMALLGTAVEIQSFIIKRLILRIERLERYHA